MLVKKTKFERKLECPICKSKCNASYLITEGLPTVKLIHDYHNGESHSVRTECCCCWEDKEKTAHSSFIAEIPYSGDGEIEFISSWPVGECK